MPKQMVGVNMSDGAGQGRNPSTLKQCVETVDSGGKQASGVEYQNLSGALSIHWEPSTGGTQFGAADCETH